MKASLLPHLNLRGMQVNVLANDDMNLEEFYYDLKNIQKQYSQLLDDKDEAPMFSFWELKDGETHYIKDNCVRTTAVVLDVDDSCIEMFERNFMKHFPTIGYILYTTHRHSNEFFKNRFRVIIELEEALYVNNYERFIRGFRANFESLFDIDESTWSLARRFVYPKSTAMIKLVTGDKLNPAEWVVYGHDLMREENEKKPKFHTNEENKGDNFFKNAVKKVERDFYSGNRDNWLTKRCFFLEKNGCKADEAMAILGPYLDQLPVSDRDMRLKFENRIRKMK